MNTIILAILSLQDFAPEEIEQLRTQTAYVLDAGEIESDLVVSYLESSDLSLTRIDLEIEFGVTDSLMLEIEVPYLFRDPHPGRRTDGFGDLDLEGKYLLYSRLPFTVGAGIEIGLPSGDEDKGLGDGEVEYGFFAACSVEFGLLSAHVEMAAETDWDETAEYEVNVALDFRPWGREFSFHVGMNSEFSREALPYWAILTGIEARPQAWEVQAGVAALFGLGEHAGEWGILFDAEIEF
jgi:hypothetical protein